MTSLTHKRVLLALSIAFCFACSKPKSDEDLIRDLLNDGAQKVEARDIKGAADHLSDHYKDKDGRDKTTLKRVAFFMTRQMKPGVHLSSIVVKVEGLDATASFTALVTDNKLEVGKVADLVPRNAKKLDLEATLKKEDGTWRVTAMSGDNMRSPY